MYKAYMTRATDFLNQQFPNFAVFDPVDITPELWTDYLRRKVESVHGQLLDRDHSGQLLRLTTEAAVVAVGKSGADVTDGLPARVVILILDVPTANTCCIAQGFAMSGKAAPVGSIALKLDYTSPRADATRYRFILIQDHPDRLRLFMAGCLTVFGYDHVYPAGTTAVLESFNQIGSMAPPVAEAQLKYQMLEFQELIDYLITHADSPDHKLTTIIYSLYPWTRMKIAATHVHHVTAHGDPNYNVTVTRAESTSISALTAATMCWAFSTPDTKITQMHKRLSSALSGYGIGIPNPDEFRTTVVGMQCVKTSPSSLIVEMMGWLLAVDDDGDYDPTLTNETLGKTTTLQSAFHLSNITCALYEQLRMVYLNWQTNTIRFATTELTNYETYFNAKGTLFEAEVTAVKKLKAEIDIQPYIGLQKRLPENLRVVSIPRACLTGLYAHARFLETTAEETAWKAYNIPAIADKVKDPKDKSFCYLIAQTIAQPTLATLAELVANLPLARAQILLTQFPDITEETVYSYMHSRGLKGAWFDEKHEIELKKMMKIVQEEALGKMQGVLDRLSRKIRIAAEDVTNDDLKDELMRNWRRHKQVVLSNLEDLMDTTDELSNYTTVIGDEARATVNTAYTDLIRSSKALMDQIIERFTAPAP